MSTAVAPDIEALVATYLLQHDAVEALVDDRVGARHPESTAAPWVKVTQVGDEVRSDSLHGLVGFLQFDCYGGDDIDEAQGEASGLVRTVRAALNDMPSFDHVGAVVSVVRFGGSRRIPDTDFSPARERFVLDASVYFHAESA